MLFTSKTRLSCPQHKGLVCSRPCADKRRMATRLHSTRHVSWLFPFGQHNSTTRKHKQWAADLHKIYGGWSKQYCEAKGSCYSNCWLLKHTKKLVQKGVFPLSVTRKPKYMMKIQQPVALVPHVIHSDLPRHIEFIMYLNSLFRICIKISIKSVHYIDLELINKS